MLISGPFKKSGESLQMFLFLFSFINLLVTECTESAYEYFVLPLLNNSLEHTFLYLNKFNTVFETDKMLVVYGCLY